jgi:beta-glucosidase
MSFDNRLPFPEGFIWGTATASYQVEGAVHDGGRGPSIWDTFSHTPGKVFHDDNGDVTCDQYHRYREDAALMGSLGLGAYRFSIAWPRVQPDGTGPANQAGLDYYRRLIEALKTNGVEPAVTLYHWDLPQALQDKGGWTSRDTAERFAEFAHLIGEALADDVNLWITLNEPWVSAFAGHELGQHAPGIRDTAAAVRASHHLLLGHGKAARVLRSVVPSHAQIGITLNLYPVYPATSSPEDAEAAAHVGAYGNRWFLDPVLSGTYPSWMHAKFREVIGQEFVQDGDLQEIHADIDFLGVNYYTTRRVGAAKVPAGQAAVGSEVEASSTARRPYPWYLEAIEVPLQDVPRTTKGWAIQPEGLKELLVWLRDEYGERPLYVTENGAAFADYVDPHGVVSDPERVEYLRRHFVAAHEAIAAGVNLRGYFVWSFCDNFEWADGYSQRFGIVFVDYKTQQRTPKASAAFMARVAKDNAVSSSRAEHP